MSDFIVSRYRRIADDCRRMSRDMERLTRATLEGDRDTIREMAAEGARHADPVEETHAD